MAQLDLVKLAAQGRAYSPIRPWSEKELVALLALEAEGLSRREAAEYVRNGILSVEDYQKAVKAKFEPTSLEDIHKEAEANHADAVAKKLKLDAKKPKKKSDKK